KGDRHMKRTFVLPPRSVASSLPGIAKHVSALNLIQLPRLSEGEIEISRQGRKIRWQTADDAVTFDVDALAQIEIQPVEFGPGQFIAIVLTFHDPNVRLSYRFVTSHATESDWLIQTANEVGELLEMPVENRLPTPATTR